jgi:hypothetical protein
MMPLDLSIVVKQISEMASRLKKDRVERQAKISAAVDTLHAQSQSLDKLKKKIALSKTTWLVAEPVEQLDRTYGPTQTPVEYTVLATDGSHIDVDRHQSTRCYLINTSSILLKYGPQPDAILESEPKVYSNDEDLMISSPDKLREVPVEGALLGIKRGVEECRKLAEMANKVPAGRSALALVDGTLIMWSLEAYPDFVSELFLEKGFLTYLDSMRKLNQDRHLAVAAYISYPRSTDVVNALRVALCPKDIVDSDKCTACTTRECNNLSGVPDRELFGKILKTGERSALFISPSRIQKRYGPHLVHFFYVKLDDEIARVEVPAWVAKSEELLTLTHSLILDQCRRGHGYPVSLSEAHEKAVVTGSDRENFWQLVEESLVGEHISSDGSAKSQSKRTRWV